MIPEHQAIKKKLHITEVAMNLFKELGYASVKVVDICRAADVSLGTFYHYFSSKDDIIDESYQAIDALVFERIGNIATESPAMRIIEILKRSGEVMQHELGAMFVTQSYHQIISKKTSYSFSHHRNLFLLLQKTIEEGITQGCIRPGVDPEGLTELCLRVSRGVIFDWCLQDGTYDLSKVIEHDLRLMIHAYLTSHCQEQISKDTGTLGS